MFDNQISEFTQSLNGLREFHKVIEPILKEKEIADSLLKKPLLSGLINNFLGKQIGKLSINDSNKSKMLEIPEQLIESMREVIDKNPFVKESLHRSFNSISDSQESSVFSIKTDEVLSELKSQFNHVELLKKNALISLVGFAEWFFVQILHYFFDHYPEAASIDKQTIAFEDLKNFSSIKDAQEYLIEAKIENIIRGSLDSWFKYLKQQFGLSMPYLKFSNDRLTEIYQRRNLLVHNGGVVNNTYINKVNSKFRENIHINDKISIDGTYLEEAIDLVESAFVLIAAEIWSKNEPLDLNRPQLIERLMLEAMESRRWLVVERFAQFILNDKTTSNLSKLLAQLNFWLAKKNQGQYELVLEEILKADYSDKPIRYQLAFSALKDDIESFLKQLEEAIITKQLDINEIDHLPIFSTIKTNEKYLIFKKELLIKYPDLFESLFFLVDNYN